MAAAIGAGAPSPPGTAPVAPGPRLARPRVVPPTVPHGRLGVLWALVTAVAALSGRPGLAVWLAAGGAVAVLGVARSWGLRPVGAFGALIGAVGAPLAVLQGGLALALALSASLAVGALLAFSGLPGIRPKDTRPTALRVPPGLVAVAMAGLAVGLCGASLVVLYRQSVTLMALVLALTCCHDASRYLVGWGAPSPWEGRVAGLAALGTATLVIAVLQPTPVSGAYPWLLGLVLMAAGVGGKPFSRMMEAEDAPQSGGVGALRRLDTLLLAAPAVVLMSAFGHL